MRKKLVLSLSGGMDSSVLLFLAAREGFDEIHTVTFDYGQRHKREIKCVGLQIQDLKEKHPRIICTNKVLDVSYLKDIALTSSLTNLDIDNPVISQMAGDAQPVSYVPFRNQMFLSICCSYGESLKADTIWYGAAQVDSLGGYWDTTQCYIDLFNETISQNRNNLIRVEAPLLNMSKKDIVNEGVELGVYFSKTWTCYSNHPSGLADLTTTASSLRVKGFIDAGYRDPVRYIQQSKLEEIYKEKECRSLE